MASTRRLAAILAADVVGYSRLMGLDEAGTVQALREHRSATNPLIAEHGGRVVKTTGDGVLIEFGSVVGAVECALGLQRLAEERNTAIASERRMEWRIGVHLGDVLIEGEDILGDGVNIAARLEGIAEPGGICISDDPFGKCAVRSRWSLPISVSRASRTLPGHCGSTACDRPQ
jgi:adenylate cyclase